MSKHPIIHIELSANDLEAGAKYYSELFGWEFQQIPDMNYATFIAEGGPGGGLNPVADFNPAGTVMVYVNTDDIDDTLDKVQKLGGKVVAPKAEIPGVGWFAFIADPTGNKLGVLEPIPGQ